ncbi:hypothetical protein AAHC03_022537 [Spirometra sp. Aus1]
MFIAASNAVVRTWSTLADSNRSRVLSLYRRILRLAQNWSSADGDPVKTAQERDYIREEARRLFRRNARVTDPAEINAHILEAESRIELALHYKTPYPRLSNIPQSTLAGGTSSSRAFRRTRRLIDESVPAYLKSYSQTEPEKPVASSSPGTKKTDPTRK